MKQLGHSTLEMVGTRRYLLYPSWDELITMPAEIQSNS